VHALAGAEERGESSAVYAVNIASSLPGGAGCEALSRFFPTAQTFRAAGTMRQKKWLFKIKKIIFGTYFTRC